MAQQQAVIVNYEGHHLDEFGEAMIGFYWQLLHEDESPMSHLMGPYHTHTEAEAACQRAWEKNDYS